MLAASAQGWTYRPVPLAVHYLGAYGPMLAAIITTWLTEGGDGVRRLAGRMVRWRVRPLWWLVAASPLLLYGVAAGVLRLMRGTWTDVGLLRHPSATKPWGRS